MIRASLIVLLGIGGCRACNEPRILEIPEQKVALRPYEIEPFSLFDWTKSFSYSSKLELVLGRADEQSASREFIEATGFNGQIHMTKKIDEAHYFEVFADNKSYLVKNREGEWRENKDNKPFVEALIKDGFNANDWFIEHLGLGEFLVKDERLSIGKNFYVLEKAKIKFEAPFWKNLGKVSPEYKELKNAAIRGSIEIDAKKVPLLSNFIIEAQLDNGHWLKLSVETKLVPSANEVLAKPKAIKDGPLLYPINIVPKFNELMSTKPDSGGT